MAAATDSNLFRWIGVLAFFNADLDTVTEYLQRKILCPDALRRPLPGYPIAL